MEFTYIESEKGKQQLLRAGYVFNKERSTSEKTIWKCSYYFKTKCLARVHVVGSIITNIMQDHNHAADAANVEVKRHMQNIRAAASTSFVGSTQAILSSESETVSVAAAAKMPQMHSIKRRIREYRADINDPYELIPKTHSFIMPEKYKFTAKNQPFIFYDSISENPTRLNRMIIFSTEENISLLDKSSEWYADGTFSVCPGLFSQLYVIHGLINNHPLPLAFVLLPNKTKNTYIKMLNLFKNRFSTIKLRKVYMDFEIGAINAFKTVFPLVEFQLCFFHFKKAVYRKLSSIENLKILYDTDATFALNVKHLIALAFVPVDKVVQYFDTILSENIIPDVGISLIDYFEDTYIGRMDTGGIRRTPIFPISYWNCYEAALTKGDKTNNRCEGWNNGFRHAIKIDHPNMWIFIRALISEQAKNEMAREQYMAGDMGEPQRKKYKDSAERCASAVKNVSILSEVAYLRSIAHNFEIGFVSCHYDN